MRSPLKSLRNRLFEQLESRTMLAGNVSAYAAGGSLFVNGDKLGNGVQVSQFFDGNGNAVAGKLVVAGFTQDGSKTFVNGANSALISGVTRDWFINLGAGNDSLALTNGDPTTIDGELLQVLAGQTPQPLPFPALTAPRNVFVDLSTGNDAIRTDGLIVKGDFHNHVGNGANVVHLFRTTASKYLSVISLEGTDEVFAGVVTVGGKWDVITGSGADLVVIANTNLKQFFLDSGAGDDTVVVQRTEFGGNVTLLTGLGKDIVSMGVAGNYEEGPGDDKIIARGDVLIDTGADLDFFEVENATFVRTLVLFAGSGDDQVFLGRSTVGLQSLIDVGAGADNLQLSQMTFHSNLKVLLGAGNDVFTIFDTLLKKQSLFDAGSGNDSLSFNRLKSIERLFIYLGDGNDTLFAAGCTLYRPRLEGGAGRDTFLKDPNQPNSLTQPEIVGVEVIG